jgi:hypothetical protein
VRKYGEPGSVDRLKATRGSGYVNKEGYRLIYLPDHPNARKSGQVLEHYAVMTKIIGRPLYQDETVHHINGDKLDNRPKNLEIWSSRHPKGQRAEDIVSWAVEMLRRYAPDRLTENRQ